jgi:hypothetical protein
MKISLLKFVRDGDNSRTKLSGLLKAGDGLGAYGIRKQEETYLMPPLTPNLRAS